MLVISSYKKFTHFTTEIFLGYHDGSQKPNLPKLWFILEPQKLIKLGQIWSYFQKGYPVSGGSFPVADFRPGDIRWGGARSYSYTVIFLSVSMYDIYYAHVQITPKGRFHLTRKTKDGSFLKSRVGFLKKIAPRTVNVQRTLL